MVNADDTEVDDTLADFSNYGSPVDIAAPGYCVLSTIPTEYNVSLAISRWMVRWRHLMLQVRQVLASNGMTARDRGLSDQYRQLQLH